MMNAPRVIGMLGGMSWESSAQYYRLANELVRERLGGLHSARIVLASVDFADIEALQVAGRWGEAGQLLAEAAKGLEAAGAELLVICTNTMHKVAEQVQAAVGIPLLHLGDATAAAVTRAGLGTVGLLGTAFTMEQDFYRDRLTSHGLRVLIPPPADRAEVHRIIYDELCVGVVREESRQAYRDVILRLVQAGVCAGQTQMAPHPRRGLFPLKSSSREVVTTGKAVDSGAAPRRSTTARRQKLSLPDPRGAVLASRWLRDGGTPGWARKHTPTGWAAALAEPARYGWNAEDLNAVITDWATDTGQVAAPATPVAFLRWLLQRHDLAFSPTLLEHARRDQERAAAQEQRERAAQELARSAQARATARADLSGPGRQLAQQVLAQAVVAAGDRKAAAIRAEHAARAAAVARVRGRR